MFSKHTSVSLATAAFLGTCACAFATAFAADVPKPGSAVAPVIIVPNAIVQSNNQISLDAVISRLHYVEDEPTLGGFVDSEDGWIPGFVASATFMGNRSATGHHLYVSGSFRFVTGNTAYRDFQGFSDTDHAVILNEDARVGIGYDLGPNSMLTPYLGFGARQWSRDVAPHIPGGYNENYAHEYIGGGLLLQHAQSPRWVWSAYGLVGTTFDARMRLKYDPFAIIFYPLVPPQHDFSLGSAMIFMTGLSADVAITERWHANFGVDYEQFDYGKSPFVIPPFNLYEPHSRTQQLTLKAGLGLAF